MPDREKAINCLTDIEQIMVCRQEICPREELQYWIELQEGVADALALLKEQEAVEPCSMNTERTYGICPKCGKIVFRYGNVEENHYCGVCGQAVKWE